MSYGVVLLALLTVEQGCCCSGLGNHNTTSGGNSIVIGYTNTISGGISIMQPLAIPENMRSGLMNLVGLV